MIRSRLTIARPALTRASIDALIAAILFAALFWVGMYLKNRAHQIRLSDLPSGLVLAVVLPAAVALSCAGQSWVHRRFSYRDFVAHNEVGGYIIAVAGTLYAVLLGFLTLVAWQQYTDARQLVATESAAAADAWHVALGLPPARRHRVRSDVLEYSTLMISKEWPAMSLGDSDLRSAIVIMDAICATESFIPSNLEESNAQSATLQQLGTMHDVRQRRLADNRSGVTAFEWVVLMIGAACVICFCWVFGLPNARVHLLMTSAVTVIIASTLVLLFELQYPFRSGLGIDASDWTAVIEHIHWMQNAQFSSMHQYMRM